MKMIVPTVNKTVEEIMAIVIATYNLAFLSGSLKYCLKGSRLIYLPFIEEFLLNNSFY
ncbi:MAG: hypothetical protein LBV42_05145 [Methanobrevibacter sp.]|nr:hypothetical protein [Methanobrevibacter sp.]